VTLKYRPEIDGLRALAVLPVIFYHGGFPGFGGGFLGVDVFFVISGYLITSLLCGEHAEDRFSIARFYERRARRILPALFLVLFACLPMAWRWLVPGDMHEFCESVLAVLGFASNIFFWRESSDYFSTAAELKPLLHTWSLGVEEQFYIFYPLILAAIWRYARKWLPWILLAGAILSLALAQWAVVHRPTAAFYLLPTRAWELLLGGLAAVHLRKRPHPPRQWISEAGGLAGVAMLLVSVVAFRRDAATPGVLTLIPTMGAAFVVLFATPSTVAGRILGARWLVTIGLISYSAYLWHQPLFVFARQAMPGKPGLSIMILLAIASLVLAYATWRLVEQPFRNRSLVGRKALVRSALASALALAVFGAGGAGSDGFRQWKVDAREAALLASASFSPLREACHIRSELRRPSRPCEYFHAPPTWAVIGDSHAVELAYALASALDKRGEGLRHYSRSSCGPEYMDAGPPSDCRTWTRQVLDEVASDRKISTVVLSYRINLYMTGTPVYPGQATEYSDIARRNRMDALRNILDKLLASGKRVVFVLQAPELPKRMENLALVSGITADGDVRGASRAWWDERNRYAQAFRDLAGRRVAVVDPTDLFCDAMICHAARDGVSLYFDDNHMSVAGAKLVAAKILEAEGAEQDAPGK
jgi:peptidoglycan/LPS O-acetylase OafA/YrhL